MADGKITKNVPVTEDLCDKFQVTADIQQEIAQIWESTADLLANWGESRYSDEALVKAYAYESAAGINYSLWATCLYAVYSINN